MKVIKSEKLECHNWPATEHYVSLLEMFGKYYVYFSLSRPTFWGLFKSVYIFRSQESVDPLCAPIVFRDTLEGYNRGSNPINKLDGDCAKELFLYKLPIFVSALIIELKGK